jgi:hypothetical protein
MDFVVVVTSVLSLLPFLQVSNNTLRSFSVIGLEHLCKQWTVQKQPQLTSPWAVVCREPTCRR